MRLADIIDVFIAGDWGNESQSEETPNAVYSKTVVFSFRKYSFSRTALRTCFALYVPIRNARAIIVSRL